MQKQLCGSGLSGLFRVFLFFGFGVALSGCGTPKISPSSLSRPDAEQILKIKNDYEYSYNGTFGSVGKYAVTPGEYRTEFKGQGGTFFRGSDHPVRFTAIYEKRKSVRFYEGGVFVPDDITVSAKIYLYGDRYYDADTIVEPQLNYPLDGKTSGQPAQNQNSTSAIDTVTNLVVPPTATPNQALTGGIGAGIGLAIAQAMIRADAGKIMFSERQPEKNFLRDAIEW